MRTRDRRVSEPKKTKGYYLVEYTSGAKKSRLKVKGGYRLMIWKGEKDESRPNPQKENRLLTGSKF